jgi:hypothetical protein
MSNQHPKILLKMNISLHQFLTLLESIAHPAAGKAVSEKKRKRNSAMPVYPSGTPDSRNIRGVYKSQDCIRRNPAP